MTYIPQNCKSRPRLIMMTITLIIVSKMINDHIKIIVSKIISYQGFSYQSGMKIVMTLYIILPCASPSLPPSPPSPPHHHHHHHYCRHHHHAIAMTMAIYQNDHIKTKYLTLGKEAGAIASKLVSC